MYPPTTVLVVYLGVDSRQAGDWDRMGGPIQFLPFNWQATKHSLIAQSALT
jgi:hypothetical protein